MKPIANPINNASNTVIVWNTIRLLSSWALVEHFNFLSWSPQSILLPDLLHFLKGAAMGNASPPISDP
jgi:hypothetical protein